MATRLKDLREKDRRPSAGTVGEWKQRGALGQLDRRFDALPTFAGDASDLWVPARSEYARTADFDTWYNGDRFGDDLTGRGATALIYYELVPYPGSGQLQPPAGAPPPAPASREGAQPAQPGQPVPPDKPATREEAAAWYHTGAQDARAGRAMAWSGTYPAGSVGWNYQNGYRAGQGGYVPPERPPEREADPTTSQGWWERGWREADRGLPPRGDLGDVDRPVPGSPLDWYMRGYRARTQQGQPPVGGAWTGPVLDPRQGYELYGSVLLLGGVPFNVAVAAERFGFPVGWQLLGDEPDEETRGFGLSGPSGRVKRLAEQRFPGRLPEEVGLPGWVGVVEWQLGAGRRVRLLSAEEIRQYLGPHRVF